MITTCGNAIYEWVLKQTLLPTPNAQRDKLIATETCGSICNSINPLHQTYSRATLVFVSANCNLVCILLVLIRSYFNQVSLRLRIMLLVTGITVHSMNSAVGQIFDKLLR